MPDDVITDAFKSMFPELKRHLDMTTLRHWSKKIDNAKNILNKSGKKYYSQNDEDGILLEILNRMNKKKGSFLEISVESSSRTNLTTLGLTANIRVETELTISLLSLLTLTEKLFLSFSK